MQDSGSSVANQVVGDPNIVGNACLRRELQQDVGRTTNVNWRGIDGSNKRAKPLSLAEASQKLKGGVNTKNGLKKKSSSDHTPHEINFLQNKGEKVA